MSMSGPNCRKKSLFWSSFLLAFCLEGIFSVVAASVETSQLPPDRSANQIDLFWQYAKNAYQANDWLAAAHLYAAVASRSNDPVQIKAALHKITGITSRLFLVSQFQLDMPLAGAIMAHSKMRIATWSYNRLLQLWDGANGTPLCGKIKHPSDIWGAKFSSDDRYLLTWGADSTVRIWNLDRPGQLFRIMKCTAAIKEALFTHDNRLVIAWDLSGHIQVLKISSGFRLHKPILIPGGIKKFLLAPDDQHFLVLSRLGKVYWFDIWSLTTPKRIVRHPNKEDRILGFSLDRDGKHLLTWSSRNIYLWNLPKGKIQYGPVQSSSGLIKSAILSHDGQMALVRDAYLSAHLRSVKHGIPLSKPLLHQGNVLGSIFGKNDSVVLTWSDDNYLRLFRTRDGSPAIPPIFYPNGIKQAFFCNEDRWVGAWGEHGMLRLWDTNTAKPVSFTIRHIGKISGVEFNRSRNLFLTWSEVDRTVKVWKIVTHREAQQNSGVIFDDESGDLYFPPDLTPLLVEIVTGTAVSTTGQIFILSPEQWQQKKEIYQKVAELHFQKCRFKNANIYLFQNELWRK